MQFFPAIIEAILNPIRPERFTVKALKQYIGQKGSRCDFFVENYMLVWSVRWVSGVPIRRKRVDVEEFYNQWEGEGNLWQKSKKYENQFYLNTPRGLLVKTLVKIKDRRYLGNAGVQPKSATKQ